MSMRDAAALARKLSTDVSDLRMNPVSYNPDGSWEGLAAEAAAEKERRVSVWMESLDDSHSRMADLLDTQADANARWDAAPTEADVNRARAEWVKAVLGDDDAEAARLKAVYESIDAERKAEKARWEKACEETKAELDELAGECAVPEDDRTTPGDETHDPADDPADDPDGEDEDDEEGEGKGNEGDGEDPSKPKSDDPETTTTSPSPSPSTQRGDGVTSPTTSSGYQEPHIVLDAPPRTELSSDTSASTAASTPKVYPSTAQQPTTFTAAPQQPSVMMPTTTNVTPAAQSPSQTTQQSQQAYRPAPTSAPSPSHTQRESKGVDGTDPVSLVGTPVPTAVPSHAPMPSGGNTVSPSTSLSSSAAAPSPAAAHPNAAPVGAAPVGTPPPSVGAGNKTTVTNNTKVIAADQPDSSKSAQQAPTPPAVPYGEQSDTELHTVLADVMKELTSRGNREPDSPPDNERGTAA